MKLNNKKTIFVGFAFLLICMFWQVYDTVIAKMLIDSFGLNQTWSGLVMALDNILAIVLLPVFGALSDKTHTKRGKRTPYIFIGTILAAVLITGVSVFDNAQMAKVKDANINNVETITITDNIKYDVYNTDNVLEKDHAFENGDKIYSFEYNGVKSFYIEKEDAVNARSPYVTDVRVANLGYYIGFLIMLCFVLVAMSSFRTPAVSLMPDVTPKPLRSKANAIINLMGTAGGIISLLFLNFVAKDYQSYTLTFVVLGLLMIIALAVFMWKVNEPKLVEQMHAQQVEYGVEDEKDVAVELEGNEKMPSDVKKSFILILISIVFWFMAYNAATSKFSVYATNILDTGYTIPLLIAQGSAVICYIPIGIIASKVGRKKTILAGIIILFIAFLLACFVNENTAFLIIITMALAGIGWATINVNSYPMVVEMSKGNNIGKYTGIYYTASMAAQIVTPVLSGFFMDIFGTMRVLFPYCVLFSAFAFTTMMFVKHGDSKPIPTKKLEAYEGMDD